jgi:hypothetical protein
LGIREKFVVSQHRALPEKHIRRVGNRTWEPLEIIRKADILIVRSRSDIKSGYILNAGTPAIPCAAATERNKALADITLIIAPAEDGKMHSNTIH